MLKVNQTAWNLLTLQYKMASALTTKRACWDTYQFVKWHYRNTGIMHLLIRAALLNAIRVWTMPTWCPKYENLQLHISQITIS